MKVMQIGPPEQTAHILVTMKEGRGGVRKRGEILKERG